MGASDNNKGKSLDLLLNAFCEEQQEAEREKERIREEERSYEEQQRILVKEYEEKQRTAAGRNDAEENIAKLRSLARKKELAGIKIDAKQYYIGEKFICISDDLIEEGKINKLFSDKARQLISQLFHTKAVKINKVEDIIEKFFPAVREQIIELCSYYQMLCQKLGLGEKAFEEIYEEFADEWLNDDFLEEYAEILEDIMTSITISATEMGDTEFEPNLTFNMNSMIRYSILYQGSLSAMVKTDVMDVAQSALASLGNRLVNGYGRYKLNIKLKKCAEQLQELVKRSDRHIAMWCWEMQSNVISLLQNKGMIKESVDEIMSVDAVATYIMDDIETDKRLSESDIDTLCDLMLSGDPTNPVVLYLFIRKMPKADIGDFLRLIDDVGCSDSLMIALNMFCYLGRDFLKVDKDSIIAMSSDERDIFHKYFYSLLDKSVKGTFLYECLDSICEEIRNINVQERREENQKQEEEQRKIRRAKAVFAYTPEEESTIEYLKKQIDFVSEVNAEISNSQRLERHKDDLMLQYAWQVSDESIIKIFDDHRIGNEYIFVYDDKYIISDKAWYKWDTNQKRFLRNAYADIDEIILVQSYETLTRPSHDALLFRKNDKFTLEYMNTTFSLARNVLSIIGRVLLRSCNSKQYLYYDTDFAYCHYCNNVERNPLSIKKCAKCHHKIKDVGLMHKRYDGWEKLSDKLLNVKQKYASELLQDIDMIYPVVEHVESVIPESFSERLLKLLRNSMLNKYVVDENVCKVSDKNIFVALKMVRERFPEQQLLYYNEKVIVTEDIIVWGNMPMRISEISSITCGDDFRLHVVYKNGQKYAYIIEDSQDRSIIELINQALGNLSIPNYI